MSDIWYVEIVFRARTRLVVGGLMKKLVWLVACVSVACALVCVVGCSSGGGEDVEEEKLASLMFSQMEVACERRDGWFGARHAEFKVSGSVKNNTENPINKDNLPALEAEDSSESYEPKITQDKLLAGETCDVTYEGDLDVGDGNVSTLSFTGGFDFDGLQDAEAELNAKLKGVVDDYGQEDAEKEEAEAKRRQEKEAAEEEAEAEKAAAEAKKQQDHSDLEACKGKTAAEALDIARGTDYECRFLDDFEVDVTDDVKTAADGSELSEAKVGKVEINEGGWFSSAGVTFRLDYVDPDAARERKEKEEQEAAEKERQQKEQEEKEAAKAKKEQDRKDIEACKGKTAAEAYAVAEGTDYPFRFVDSFDVEVTDNVKLAARAAAQTASADEAEEKDAVANGDGKTVSGEKGAGEKPSTSNAKSEAAAKSGESESSAKGEDATKGEESDSTADGKDSTNEESAKDAKADAAATTAEDAKADAKTDTATTEGSKADAKATSENADAKDAKTDAKATEKNADKAASEEVSKVGEAAVTEVEVSEDGLFSEAGVTFHLDYVDPAGAEERRAKLPTVTFSNMEYNVHLVPATADKPYSLAVSLTGTVKVAASKDGNTKVALVESLPTLSVKADKKTSSTEVTCDDGGGGLNAGKEYAFSYVYVAPHKEKNPTYKFSLKKGDGINVKGIDKKVLADMEKHYNARMGNLPAEIAEYEENERQRQEQERIEAEQRAEAERQEQERLEAERQEQERLEAEQRAAEQQAERERKEAARRQLHCWITETGHSYHNRNCPTLSRSHNLIEITVGEAEDMGLDKCDRCH